MIENMEVRTREKAWNGERRRLLFYTVRTCPNGRGIVKYGKDCPENGGPGVGR